MVSDLLSSIEGGRDVASVTPLKTYTEKFNELFPYYLAIGMTEEQYWDKDCDLVVYYRKAETLRIDRKNQEMWLQGAYFYDALCRISPILHAFARKGTKPSPYPTEPYAITDKQVEFEQMEKHKKVYDRGKKIMEGFMIQNNKKFKGG
ncbi:MAG TPA: hypothetical protein IAD34_09215 [Candidatus Scatovicinus merdipullorum]|nr:hypothetical protein [Candidatus Scatovicinus merdipullorum]